MLLADEHPLLAHVLGLQVDECSETVGEAGQRGRCPKCISLLFRELVDERADLVPGLVEPQRVEDGKVRTRLVRRRPVRRYRAGAEEDLDRVRQVDRLAGLGRLWCPISPRLTLVGIVDADGSVVKDEHAQVHGLHAHWKDTFEKVFFSNIWAWTAK